MIIIGNGSFGNTILNRCNDSRIWNLKEEIVNKNVIIAVPILSFEDVYSKICNRNNKIIIATKGISPDGKYPSEMIIYKEEYAILGGPNISKEIDEGNPTYSILETDYNIDLILNEWTIIKKKISGLEIVNTMKNVLAIICGFCSSEGNNALSIVLGAGISIIEKTIKENNLQFSNLYIPDIISTCTSTNSRNYRYGLYLSDSNYPLPETVEGKNSIPGLINKYKTHPLIDIYEMMSSYSKKDIINTCINLYRSAL